MQPDGWRVSYQDAVDNWLRKSPPLLQVGSVTDFLSEWQDFGPPDGAIEIEDDRYLVVVPGTTGLTIEYLVVVYETAIIVKSIG